jgi:hypothetical protein
VTHQLALCSRRDDKERERELAGAAVAAAWVMSRTLNSTKPDRFAPLLCQAWYPAETCQVSNNVLLWT